MQAFSSDAAVTPLTGTPSSRLLTGVRRREQQGGKALRFSSQLGDAEAQVLQLSQRYTASGSRGHAGISWETEAPQRGGAHASYYQGLRTPEGGYFAPILGSKEAMRTVRLREAGWSPAAGSESSSGTPGHVHQVGVSAKGRSGREASHTCGHPPEDFCPHVGAPGVGAQCQRCDAGDPQRHHNASYLTDFHSQDDSTWWQSPSMAFGVQYPTSVNITLRLGKAYEITYVRLKFHTSRPESFAIYKRTHAGGAWQPYQYYSASCRRTYGRPEGQYPRPGEDERVAFCTSEFSDISPLSGGNVAFSTLEGRPSAYNFEESPVLQDWVTSTELLISLDRLNTFGDDIFKDPKVLQSYYYAVSDLSVGGRCKCNGHASECGPEEGGRLVCRCQHNTTGTDCERCLPFFQDRPWARGTAEAANECLPCNCSGRSEECVFDRELFRRTGHGGRCLHCRDHTAGPHCERCQEDFYRWSPRTPCQPCDCHPAGSLRLQCDDSGTCACKPTVTGWKCDRCLPGFHSLSEGGCRPCTCSPAGSLGTCEPHSGRCPCKENVEGKQCDRCRPGTFNLQPHNPAGCSNCFCYGHSKVCTAAAHFREHHILSDLRQGAEGWRAASVGRPEHPARWSPRGLLLSPEDGEELTLPEKFLGDQRFSYGQPVTLTFWVPRGGSPLPVQLRLEGAGLALTLRHSSLSGPRDAGQPGEGQLTFLLQETSEDVDPPLPPFHFQQLLANLTALRIRAGGQSGSPPGRVYLTEVRLTSARRGLSPPASWVEACSCPEGYTGQFCESCAPGYKRETPLGGPYTSCVPCTCNQHGTCDPHTGICLCGHHTEGPSCERCLPGFYGNPLAGQADDCQPCPCPGQSACTVTPESGEVVCTHCPPGQRGRRCEICDDGYFGDPLGLSGAPQPCRRCQCSGNIDPNAVGNCDPQSGGCLRCLHNTRGVRCERCEEGFFGSALAPRPADKCMPCSCNPRGSVSEQGPCDPVTGQCTCLPHVTGRDCSRCCPGFYDLQPRRGCRSCACHPLGAQEDRCHPRTGQCPCRPGVEGRACDRCQLGFFSFSIKGCRACRCSPLGAAKVQCHQNGTCVCRPGFVGYKCDRCQENFFLTAGGTHCQECPSCYALVKEEASKLKARLTLMEGWLRGSDCSEPWGPLHILQGEAPWGDVYLGGLLQGTREDFLEQVTGLEGAVKAARKQLRALGRGARCAQAATEKTCVQLADLDAVLESSEEEVLQAAILLRSLVIPQEGSSQPTNWSHLATEARALARSHRDTTAKIEAIVRRALVASNTSYALLWSLVEGRAALEAQRELEDRYQEVQAAQKALGTAVAEMLPEAGRALATTQVGADAALRPAPRAAPAALKSQAGALGLKAQALEKTVESREHVVTEAARALQATAQAVVQKTEPVTQLHQQARAALTRASSSVQAATVTVTGARTLLADLEGMKLQFPRPRAQAALGRKAGAVRGRLLADLKKKTKQAERMLGNAASVSSSAKKKGQEAEMLAKDSAKLARALLRDGKQEHRRAGRLSSQAQATLRQASRQVRASQARRQELEEVEKVGAGLRAMEQQIWESRTSLEEDVQALLALLARLGSLDTHQAPGQALNETQWALERLRLRLSPPGALQGKLRLLEQESEQQELQIQSFENDLAEIRADKQNLEAILHSLPQSCASWQ
ncbi:laminin subunit gamma-3 [Suricata suricatta]|uniref:laminin subunit gamma-3 n=1 Tax=Suricata suricatta TaxID=37032 RepID=UPI001155E834|nr:laminin subunit gamma-3 [Suricata suricatta]